MYHTLFLANTVLNYKVRYINIVAVIIEHTSDNVDRCLSLTRCICDHVYLFRFAGITEISESVMGIQLTSIKHILS